MDGEEPATEAQRLSSLRPRRPARIYRPDSKAQGHPDEFVRLELGGSRTARSTDRWVLWILGPLLLFALFVRLWHFDSLPPIDADEAWYGVNAVQIIHGEAFTVRTPTGNLVNPFHVGAEALLLSLFPPSPWILRATALASGLLAVVLAYVLGRRVLDQTTALIAATLLAVLPVTIIFSRTGYDCSQTPLFSVLVLYLAFRANWLALGLCCGFAFLAHPTNCFLVTIAVPVALAVSLGREPDPKRRWRIVLVTLGVVSVVAIGLGVCILRRDSVRAIARLIKPRELSGPGWLRFLVLYGRLFLGVGEPPRPGLDVLFWGVVGPVAACGGWRLWRERAWERLALLGGIAAGAGALGWIGGREVLAPGSTRYGLFLIVPSAFAAGCLVRAILAPASPARWGWGVLRRVQLGGLLLVGWMLVLSVPLDRVIASRVIHGTPSRLKPFFAALPSAEGPTYQEVLKWIVRDQDQLRKRENRSPANSRDRILIFVEDGRWFFPLQFFCVQRKELLCASVRQLADAADAQREQLLRRVREGAYAVVEPGHVLERAILSGIPAEWLTRYDVRTATGRDVTVIRLSTPRRVWRPVCGDYDGDGTTDLAIYDFESAVWSICLSGGRVRSEFFGTPGQSWPVPADYDGDGKIDLAVFDPSIAAWRVRQSTNGDLETKFGPEFAVPVPADYDGDGRAEMAVFEPRSALWTIAGRGRRGFGQGTVFGGDPWPVPADYDGDGRADLAVYQISTGEWWISGSTQGGMLAKLTAKPGTCQPTPLDYLGKHRALPAVFSPQDGRWETRWQGTIGFVQDSSHPQRLLPAPGDYDGDGRSDPAVLDVDTCRWQLRLSRLGPRVLVHGSTP